jgi:hypothetical protein
MSLMPARNEPPVSFRVQIKTIHQLLDCVAGRVHSLHEADP